MQTRRDLYQAHQLMMHRVSLALLQGEPDAPESPMKRMTVASLSGLMVGVLVAAGFGVWGLLAKNGTKNITKSGTIIIEKETGAKYAFKDEKDGTGKPVLFPFLNYASARLAIDGTATQKSVSRNALTGYTRGPAVGIPGAPDSLPDPKKTTRAPWSLCVRTVDVAEGPRSFVSLVGGQSVGGKPLGEGAVLVKAENQVWMVWHNQRMLASLTALQALGTSILPTPVSPTWLNGVPQVGDLKAPVITGRGAVVNGPGGKRPVGKVYKVPAAAGAAEQWFVQLADGVAEISQTQATLLLRDKDSLGELGDPQDVGAQEVSTTRSGVKLFADDLPRTMPTPVSYDGKQPLCAVYAKTDALADEATMTIGGTLPELPADALNTPAAPGIADQIVLNGGGTVAGVLAGPGQPLQTFYLLTAQGTAFPVPKEDDLKRLGYEDASRRSAVPAGLMNLVRKGPQLSAVDAVKPAP